MGNPRCKICQARTHKWSTTKTGRQRYRCTGCGATQTRSNDVKARYFAGFLAFVTGRLRYADMPGKGRTARRRFAEFWKLWPVSPLVDEVHHVVFVDGIYLGRHLVILIACTKTHVLGWYVAKSENTRAWTALMQRIAAPDVVVCDGGSGIASAVKTVWPHTRVQRCVFHAFSFVKRKTTTRARTQAGVDLYALAKALLRITTRDEAVQWIQNLTQWNTTYQQFLAQRTRLPNGMIVATHRRLIEAKNSLNTLVRQGTLFTYLDQTLEREGDPIPATTNQIEGGINAQLRRLLRDHRGMTLNHQVKAALWWCYQHTEFPGTPADILATTRTDEEIIALFETATHRAHAQTEIERWGTSVNWTDLHHKSQWHHTY